MNIKEAARLSDLTPNTIRYYERLGVVPAIPRDSNGNRVFGELELQWLDLARDLRHAGVHVEKIIDYVKLVAQGETSIKGRIELLTETRDELDDKIAELEKTRNHIQFKIESYDAHMLPIEENLSNGKTEQ